MLRRTVPSMGVAKVSGLCLLVLASGCSGAVETEGQEAESTIGQVQSALTTQERIFGFEAPLGWVASAGAVGTSTIHSQGATSLSLRNASYSEISSQYLSTLSGVGTALAIDVQPPAVASFGQLQIFATSPTLGWQSYKWFGQVSLAGLPAGQFAHLSIPLGADIQQKLQQTYSDLKIILAVNAPASNTGWLLDNLHFTGATQTEDCAAGSAYSLTLENEQGVDAATLERLRCTFFAVYPQLAARFNPNAAQHVTFSFVETGNNPAWAYPDSAVVVLNKAHLAANPFDSDVVVHETMHVVQAGYAGSPQVVEGWIIEGSADYARDKYGLRKAETGWSIPTTWQPGHHFANGYGDAAGFFEWVDANYRQNQLPVVDSLDDVLRAGTYTNNTWVTLTGHDVVWLWQAYSNGQAPQPASTGVTFYRDDNYTGWSFKLAPGVYGTTELGSRGLHDAISSLVVPSGYRVIAYEHDNSQGASVQYTSNTPSVGTDWNDKISTIVVQQL